MITRAADSPTTRNECATDTTERVGAFEMRLGLADPTAEAAERWSRRSEALAEWLLVMWRREQTQA